MVFASGLQRRVFGWNSDKQSSALDDIMPDYNKLRRGDIPVTTDNNYWHACQLNALQLPAKRFLEDCPQDLKLRSALPDVARGAPEEGRVLSVSDAGDVDLEEDVFEENGHDHSTPDGRILDEEDSHDHSTPDG